jgi:putative cardiolipin synthase
LDLQLPAFHFGVLSLVSSRRCTGLAVVLALVLAGCATLPESLPMPAQQFAPAPQPDGPLAAVESALQQRSGPGESGFHLLDSNEQGLRWRLALIDSARHSLDLQYYVWWGDESGDLLMSRVIEAADRGVKVRLILDDLSTMLEDEQHLRLRDVPAAAIDSHPNIEVRLFNAWRSREIAGRALETLERMERINHRMHNKLLVADNRAAVIGGRNIGNEYFGLSPEFNFRDLDVLGIGPVARQASAVFDRFWNSAWVLEAEVLGVEVAPDELRRHHDRLRAGLAESQVLTRFPAGPQDWRASLDALPARMHLGSSRVHTDTPDDGVVNHHMPQAIRNLLASADREVLITNAYVIPDQRWLQQVGEEIAGGVRFRLLTNSLASHDVPAVNSHYKQWRAHLLQAGVELHELRHDAALQSTLADTPPVVAEFVGLHVKAAVVDRERVFIGSMNLDPRSADINSEMGVVIESPALAAELAQRMEHDMAPENAWRLQLDDAGRVRWAGPDRVLTRQPARSFWQRVEDVVFMAFPRDLY